MIFQTAVFFFESWALNHFNCYLQAHSACLRTLHLSWYGIFPCKIVWYLSKFLIFNKLVNQLGTLKDVKDCDDVSELIGCKIVANTRRKLLECNLLWQTDNRMVCISALLVIVCVDILGFFLISFIFVNQCMFSLVWVKQPYNFSIWTVRDFACTNNTNPNIFNTDIGATNTIRRLLNDT